MSRPRVSARFALVGSLLTLLLVAAGAATAGYLVEAHSPAVRPGTAGSPPREPTSGKRRPR